MTQKIYVEQDNGEIQAIIFGATDNDRESIDEDDAEETYGAKEDAIEKLKEIHGAIRFYTNYAIGAFKNLGDAQVEEVNLKFGLKISGEAGIPILTKASAESNFEISVKCKFPAK
ncbi:MAG: CU044_2847 family protein [Pseudanabaenaceae cyanobacterium]|jgi:hypothetical protein